MDTIADILDMTQCKDVSIFQAILSKENCLTGYKEIYKSGLDTIAAELAERITYKWITAKKKIEFYVI